MKKIKAKSEKFKQNASEVERARIKSYLKPYSERELLERYAETVYGGGGKIWLIAF